MNYERYEFGSTPVSICHFPRYYILMASSNSAGPSADDLNNNEVTEELSMESVRAIVAADEKRGRVSVMSSDSDEENVASGGCESNPTAEASTVSAGVTGRGVEDAVQSSQL